MAKHRGPANTAGQHWARLTISGRFRSGARTLAERSGWRIREESHELLVCTDENYTETAPRLFTLERIADAKTVDDLSAFDRLRGWAPQDGLLSDDTRRRGTDDVRRRLEAGQLPDILYALRLNIISARDAQLPSVVQDPLRFTLTRSSDASAWGIRIEPRLHWRFTALRALLAAMLTYPFNMMASVPAATVPCGVTATGLPVGLQLVARPRDDAGLLRAAACFERARPWSDRRPVP
jgi:Asp-tRNA(Asn)/Glu-tRNA(Gln) amidotransferase A subunit family amidase